MWQPVAMAMAMAMAAATVIRPEHAEGGRNHENRLLLKNAVLGLFWSFWDLLDLKNGSGSKFYARKWYWDLRKPKIKLFRCKNVKFSVVLPQPQPQKAIKIFFG